MEAIEQINKTRGCLEDIEKNIEFKKKGKEREYMREYQRARRSKKTAKQKRRDNSVLLSHREEMKKRAVDYKGNKCDICRKKFDIVCFDFHHKNPDVKKSTISSILYKTWEEIKAEVDKCILICSNCHRILHKIDKYSHLPGRKKDNQSRQLALYE